MSAPHAAIVYNAETKKFGFMVYWPGKRPHYQMHVFDTADLARNWLDPHNEREWEDVTDQPGVIAISRAYKPGSVPTRV